MKRVFTPNHKPLEKNNRGVLSIPPPTSPLVNHTPTDASILEGF